MMRYIRRLERKDVGLDTSMIPLGSCTMKLNAAAEMLPVTWPEFSRMHPFAPADAGRRLRRDLRASSRRRCARSPASPAVSLQPNSGAQGEFAGLMTIRAYHRDRGDAAARRRADSRRRRTAPIRRARRWPACASSSWPCDSHGYIELDDLRAKAAQHKTRSRR